MISSHHDTSMILFSQYPRTLCYTRNEMLVAVHTDASADGALIELRIDDHLGERLATLSIAPDTDGNASIDIGAVLEPHIVPIGYNAFAQDANIRLVSQAIQYRVTAIEKYNHPDYGTVYGGSYMGALCSAIRGGISLSLQDQSPVSDPTTFAQVSSLNLYADPDQPIPAGIDIRAYYLSRHNNAVQLSVTRYRADGTYSSMYLGGGSGMKVYAGCIYELYVPASALVGYVAAEIVVTRYKWTNTFYYVSNRFSIVPSNTYSEALLIRNRFGAWDHIPMMRRTDSADIDTAPRRVNGRADGDIDARESITLTSRYYRERQSSWINPESMLELSSASEMYLLRNGCAVPFTPKSLDMPICNNDVRNSAVLKGEIDTQYRTVMKPLPPYEYNLAAYIVDCDGNTGEGYAFGRNTNDILQNSIKRITATVAGGYIEFSPNNVFSINNLNLDYFRSIIGFDHARPYRFPLHYFTAQMYMRSFVGARSIVAGNSDNNPFPILYYFNDYTDSPYVEQYMETFGNSPIESDFPLWARWSSFADNKLVDLKGNASLDMMMTPFVQLADSLGNSISVPCNCSINPADSFSIELAIHGDWGYMSLFYLHGTDYDIELRSGYGFFVLSKIPKIGNKTSVSVADGGASVSLYWKHLHLSYNHNTGVVTMTVIGTDLPWNQTYTVTFPAMMLPAGLETFSLITFNADVNVSRNKYIDISFMRIMSLANLKAVILFSGMQAYEIMSKGYATATGTDSGNNFRANCQHIWGQCGYEIWDNDVDTLLVPLANDGASMSEGRYIPATNGRSIVNCILSNSDIIDIRSGFEFRSKSEALMARDTQFIFFEPGGMQRAISASDLRNAFLQDVWYLRARTTQYTVSYMRMKDEG